MIAARATPPVTRSASRTLPVAEVIARTRSWVEGEASHLPGFAGAYLFGSITALPPDAPFALYRDVDVIVVSTGGTKPMEENLESPYRGLMIEAGFMGLEQHASPDVILADAGIGPNFSTTTILADPLGMLAPLQRAVAVEFAQQRWVRARCEAAMAATVQQLGAMRAAPVGARLAASWFFLNELCAVLALARLARPTHRRTLTLLRDLLEEQGRLDLHERALTVWGSAGMGADAVQATLDDAAVAFDRAVALKHTPAPYDFKIQAHLRPYMVDAGQALIDEGFPREAMFWIALTHWLSTSVLHNDAPADQQPHFDDQARGLNAMLGFSAEAAWPRRIALAEQLTQEIFRMAGEVVALLPA